MLETLEEIFRNGTIEEDDTGKRIELNSHTPLEQGLFLQKIYDNIKPKKSVEVGFAFGISTLFILEKCRQYKCEKRCHIVIEPYSWGTAAMHNIIKEGLEDYVDIRSDLSDVVLPTMYLNNERIQFAYVDTTKLFDTVLQDFYFIDKILDIGGVIIIDDATTGGIRNVTRFINSLPHYKIVGKFEKVEFSKKYHIGRRLFEILLFILPFKNKFLGNYSFKTSAQLSLDYKCIAFQKIDKDARQWDWDKPF